MSEAVQKKASVSTDIFQEVGRTGLRRSGGRVYEEFLRDLQGPRGLQVFREMSANDAVVGAVLFAVEQLAKSVTWTIEHASSSSEDKKFAEFFEGALFRDMSSTWQDTVSDVLTMLPFGFSVHELVYKRRLGDSKDPSSRSVFNDGKIGWRKWPIRSQDSLFEWRFDDEGGVQAMVQQDFSSGGTYYTIPIEKSLLFRTSTRKGNPEGISILRTSYRAWWFSRRIEENEAIGIERDLAGYPMMKINREGPDLWNTADADAVQLKQKIEYLLRTVRRDEQEGLLLPWWCDFSLLSTGSRRLFDTSSILQRYAQRIAASMMADFILLGHEKVGSFALASSKTHLFAVALGSYLDSVCAVVNRHAIPRLLALNGWPTANPPKLKHGDIETPDLGELGMYVTALSGAGMPLFPDEALERALRGAAHLPMPDSGAEPEAAVAGAVEKHLRRRGVVKSGVLELDKNQFVSALRDLRDKLSSPRRSTAREEDGMDVRKFAGALATAIKSMPTPTVNVGVHPDGDVVERVVEAFRALPAPVVNVAAPRVTVEPSSAPEVTVNVQPPGVVVNVPAPVVNVPPPVVNVSPAVVNVAASVVPAPVVNVQVQAPKPTSKKVLRDAAGRVERVVEEENP